MQDNADYKIREYIRRTALSMESVPSSSDEMVKLVQQELSKDDLHLPDELVSEVVLGLSLVLWTGQGDLHAKIRHTFITEFVEKTRGRHWWMLWRDFFKKDMPLDGHYVYALKDKLNQKGYTKAVIKKALRRLKNEYPPYPREVLLQDIYDHAIWEIGGHFTVNSMLKYLEKRGLGYIDRPERAFNSLNRLLMDGYETDDGKYVLAWGRIEYYPSNAHLWPDTHGFYFREAKDKYDRGLQNGTCSY